MDLDYEEEGLDENGVKVSMTGSLWKLKKSFMGKPVWKRRWVSCDGVVVNVWNLPNREERGATAKYKFKLESCRIEEDAVGIAGRANMFKLTDTNTNKSVSLATDTPELLEEWVDFLCSDKEYDELLREVELKKHLEAERRRVEEERKMHEDDEDDEQDDDDDNEGEDENEDNVNTIKSSSSPKTDDEDQDQDADTSKVSVPAATATSTGAVTVTTEPVPILKKNKAVRKQVRMQPEVKVLPIGERIVEYFRENDVSASSLHPVIRVEDVLPLLRAIDPNCSDIVVKLIARGICSSKFVTLPDFLEWHGNYVINTGIRLEQSSVPVDSSIEISTQKRRELGAMDPILHAAKDHGQRQKFHFGTYPDSHKDSTGILSTGILDNELRLPNCISVCNKTLVETVVPDIHRLVMLESESVVDFEEDAHNVISFEWNEVYQHHIDETSNVYVHPANFTDSTESSKKNMDRCQSSVSSSLDRAAFQADFLKTAVEGARTIIDEYTLPDQYKSIRSIDRKTALKHEENRGTKAMVYQRDANEADYYEEYGHPDEQEDSYVDSSQPSLSPKTNGSTAANDYSHYSNETLSPELPDVSEADMDVFDNLDVDSDHDSFHEHEHDDKFGNTPSRFSHSTATSQSKLSSLRGYRGKRLSTADMRKFRVGLTEMGHEEMFSYRGLLFRINARGVDEAHDTEPTAARAHSLVAADEILHKEAGNEHRGLLFMKQAADSAYADQLDSFVNFEETEAESSSTNILRARTLLETVVDYAGFRVSVTCAVELNEDDTLVLGNSGVLAPQNANDSIASVDTDGGQSRLFVNAHPPLKKLLPRLAVHLNINVHQRECTASNFTLGSVEMRAGHAIPTRQVVDTLSRDIEVHRTSDGQLYFMNFSRVLLPDLPRSDTYDLETRRLRPEFQRVYAQSLDSYAYSDAAHPDAWDADMSVNSGTGQDVPVSVPVGLEKVIKACRHLYVSVLPELARVLDMLGTMPLDSYGLTQTFHSYGVGMRHIGTVYTLARSPHVRQILIVEAVGRSCKVLYNNMLRLNARKAKAHTINAETRRRSTEEHYVEHMKHVHAARRETSVRFFNLVLGSSKASTELWSTVLADLVFQKFTLNLPTATSNVSKHQCVHLPHLFLALQYHTGVQFVDHCLYNLDASAEECVLSHADISNYNLPKVKPLSKAFNRAMSSGYVGHLDSLAAPYLALGMFDKATSLLRLRLSLQITNNQHFASSETTAACAQTAYLLAFSLYRAGKFKDAVETINTQLTHGVKYTAMGGRLYMLLMCCYCRDTKNGSHLPKAVMTFDAAKAIFAFSLSSSHPIHAMLMCALADQYNYLGHTTHALAMLSTALDFTQRVLVDHAHIVTAAYQYKLAQLFLRIADTKDKPKAFRDRAFELLSDALSTYDRLHIEGCPVTDEVIHCLYDITRINMVMGLSEDAITTATRCMNVCFAKYGPGKNKSKHDAHLPDAELVLLPQAGVACMLLLGDMLVAQQHSDQAVTVLRAVWNSVRRSPSDYSSLGNIYMALTCKILLALYSQLPFPTRSLLQTIASEIEAQTYGQHGVDIPGAWNKAQETVFEAMWVNQPKEYFRALVEGLMRSEIEGNVQQDVAEFVVASNIKKNSNGGDSSSSISASKGSPKDVKDLERDGDTNTLNIHALQIGVIMRLIAHGGKNTSTIAGMSIPFVPDLSN